MIQKEKVEHSKREDEEVRMRSIEGDEWKRAEG
jgi:hypothetical protein